MKKNPAPEIAISIPIKLEGSGTVFVANPQFPSRRAIRVIEPSLFVTPLSQWVPTPEVEPW